MTLPGRAGRDLCAFLDRRAGMDPYAVQEEYVATFDFHKRASLHLSYFRDGDRRQRGATLLGLKRRYREAGLRADGRRAAGLPAGDPRVRGVRPRPGRRRDPRPHAARHRAAARVAARPRQPVRAGARRRRLGPARADGRGARRGAAHRRARARPTRRSASSRSPRRRSCPSRRSVPMTPLAVTRAATFLWLVLPYIAIVTFVVGHIWRWRRDQFTWTTRSTQLLESRWLKLGSPLFHLGLLAVIGGHVIGILVPKSLTDSLGVTENTYRIFSATMGTLAGFAMLAGLAILIARRLLNHRVRATTRGWDVAVMALLALMVATGMWNTVVENLTAGRLRLPRDRLALVPRAVPPGPGPVAHDGRRRPAELPAACDRRLADPHRCGRSAGSCTPGACPSPTWSGARSSTARARRARCAPASTASVAPALRPKEARMSTTDAPPRSHPNPWCAGTQARATRDKATSAHVPADAVRVLIVATVLFTIFFAVWMMFAIVGLPMRKEFGLSDSEFALLVGDPGPDRIAAARAGRDRHRPARRPRDDDRAAPAHGRPDVARQPGRELRRRAAPARSRPGARGHLVRGRDRVGLGVVSGRPPGVRARRVRRGERRSVDHEAPGADARDRGRRGRPARRR